MFHRVDIWLRGLDLYYSALKLLTFIVHVICGVRLWGCGAEAFDLECERVGVICH